MKRLFLILLCLLTFYGVADARMLQGVAGSVAASAPNYCAGTELFCSTFESTTAWGAKNGTSDCDGYDADGDYCDGDTTTYLIGSKSLGIRGSSMYYVEKNFSSVDKGEIYFEGWIRFDDAVSNASLSVSSSTGTELFQIALDAGGTFYTKTNDGATTYDTNYSMSADTWYHVGVYLKVESNDGTNDGIIRVWINTSTTAGFTSGNYQSAGSSSSANTGVTLADKIRIRGSSTNEVIYYDNIKVDSCTGEPWAYE